MVEAERNGQLVPKIESNGHKNELSPLTLLKEIRRDGIREWGSFKVNATHARAALQFLRSPLASSRSHDVRMRALDLLISGPWQ